PRNEQYKLLPSDIGTARQQNLNKERVGKEFNTHRSIVRVHGIGQLVTPDVVIQDRAATWTLVEVLVPQRSYSEWLVCGEPTQSHIFEDALDLPRQSITAMGQIFASESCGNCAL